MKYSIIGIVFAAMLSALTLTSHIAHAAEWEQVRTDSKLNFGRISFTKVSVTDDEGYQRSMMFYAAQKDWCETMLKVSVDTGAGFDDIESLENLPVKITWSVDGYAASSMGHDIPLRYMIEDHEMFVTFTVETSPSQISWMAPAKSLTFRMLDEDRGIQIGPDPSFPMDSLPKNIHELDTACLN